MKKIYSLFLLLAVPVILTAQGINFEKGTFNEALSKAKLENKLLFIDGYAVWCGPCLQMAKTVFLEKEVGEYFDENLIALKLDVEKGEGPFLKRKYGIEGLPGYVFLDGDGLVVYRFSAAMPTQSFMKEVKLAVSYAKDTNSVGRLAEKYKVKKDDPVFVRLYLDKLKESKSTNYTDVLEHYLSIQTDINESSKEMVVLLADHKREIIIGGLADRIIIDNYGSDAWKLYVRKNIREVYQKLERDIIDNTIKYAIEKRDTVYLELSLQRMAENSAKTGRAIDDEQRKRTYINYYLQTGNGEKYKAMVHNENETFINNIDVDKSRNHYLDWQKKKAAGEATAQYTTPFAVGKSRQIQYIISNYGKFVKTSREKEDMLHWAKVGYDIVPGDPIMMSYYADVLYMYSDKKEGLKIKEEAFRIASEKGEKNVSAIEEKLELMREGQEITL